MGFPQGNLRWCIKKKMRPVGRRGILRVKQTLEHPRLWLGQMNKKHDIKRFKVFNFISLTFIGPMYINYKDWCMHHYRITKTTSAMLDQVDLYFT